MGNVSRKTWRRGSFATSSWHTDTDIDCDNWGCSGWRDFSKNKQQTVKPTSRANKKAQRVRENAPAAMVATALAARQRAKHQSSQEFMTATSRSGLHDVVKSPPIVPTMPERLEITSPMVIFATSPAKCKRESGENFAKNNIQRPDDRKRFAQKVECRTFPEAPLLSFAHLHRNTCEKHRDENHKKKNDKSWNRYNKRQRNDWCRRNQRRVGQHVNSACRNCWNCNDTRPCSTCESSKLFSDTLSDMNSHISPNQSHSSRFNSKDHAIRTVWPDDNVSKRIEKIEYYNGDNQNDGVDAPSKFVVQDVCLVQFNAAGSNNHAITSKAQSGYQKWVPFDGATQIYASAAQALDIITDWRQRLEQRRPVDKIDHCRINTPRIYGNTSKKLQRTRSTEPHTILPESSSSSFMSAVNSISDDSTMHRRVSAHSIADECSASLAKNKISHELRDLSVGAETRSVSRGQQTSDDDKKNRYGDYNKEERVRNRNFTTLALSVNRTPPVAARKPLSPASALHLSQTSLISSSNFPSSAEAAPPSVGAACRISRSSAVPVNEKKRALTTPGIDGKSASVKNRELLTLRKFSHKFEPFRRSSAASSHRTRRSPRPHLSKSLDNKQRIRDALTPRPIQDDIIDRRYTSTDHKASGGASASDDERSLRVRAYNRSNKNHRHASATNPAACLLSRPAWDNDVRMASKHLESAKHNNGTGAFSLHVPKLSLRHNKTPATKPKKKCSQPPITHSHHSESRLRGINLMQPPDLSRSGRNRVIRSRSPACSLSRSNAVPPKRKQFIVGRAIEEAPIFLTSPVSNASSRDAMLSSMARNASSISRHHSPTAAVTQLTPINACKPSKEKKGKRNDNKNDNKTKDKDTVPTD